MLDQISVRGEQSEREAPKTISLVMAMRFQKHTSRYEGNQAGCISGFISIFDFRHGRSTRRLLADKRRAGKEVVGAGHSSIQTVPLHLAEIRENVDAEEHEMHTTEIAKTSVKELMEEEMLNEQGSENQSNCFEIDFESADSKYEKPGTLHKSINMDVPELGAAKCLMPENFYNVPDLDNLNLEIIMQELAKINQENNAGQTITVLEEKLATADLFMEQRLSNRKHFGEEKESCCSKDFMDSQQTVSSNKDLFLKLLQDRNTQLAKHIQTLQNSQLGKEKTCCSSPSFKSEEMPKDLKSDKFSSRKHLNFFHRRNRALSSFHFRGDKGCQSSSRIVVLKPGSAGAQIPDSGLGISSISLQSHYEKSNKVHNERNVSQFSFIGIKRKLRQAIGKQKQGISANRNHFYTERFAKSSTGFKKGKGQQVGNSKDSGSAMVNGVSNIYIEAKKHLSEMLNNGDENVATATRPVSISLGRILSLPGYSGSACCSPRKLGDDSLTGALMRSSPCGSVKNDVSEFLQENHANLDDEVQCVDINVSIPFKGDNECSSKTQSVPEETVTPEVFEILETTGLRPQEEENASNVHSKSSSRDNGDTENLDIKEVDNEQSTFPCLKDSSPCFKLDLFGEIQKISSPPVSREVGDSMCSDDSTERPSPVSILEPLFIHDDINPANTISQPVTKEIQPQHIQFEEQSPASSQGVCMTVSLDDEESAFEYVEAILLGSGLDWDEFLLRWISLCEILDDSLFHEVESFSGRPRYDQKLLFDCSNEVLKEVCDSYFGSFSTHNIQPVLNGINLINEVWERVERCLFQHLMLHSLDQLLKIDMARCGKWTNFISDIELISFEMGEMIFDELLQDTLLSFDYSTSAHRFCIP